MEIKGKVHCFFEQSGTFKNEFNKLGIPAEDYDIQNNFGETDHIMDLFGEIDRAYDNLTRKAKELEESNINTSNEFKIEAKKASDVAKKYWKELIRLLPESWLQTRMFDCDYATLRNIYCWRVKIPHKLTEWKQFGDWVETLPYAKELIIN